MTRARSINAAESSGSGPQVAACSTSVAALLIPLLASGCDGEPVPTGAPEGEGQIERMRGAGGAPVGSGGVDGTAPDRAGIPKRAEARPNLSDEVVLVGHAPGCIRLRCGRFLCPPEPPRAPSSAVRGEEWVDTGARRNGLSEADPDVP